MKKVKHNATRGGSLPRTPANRFRSGTVDSRKRGKGFTRAK